LSRYRARKYGLCHERRRAPCLAGVGSGHPLVKAANWLNHLDYEWESPIWKHWITQLTRHHRLIRYDERGNGLSDWEVKEMSWISGFAT